MTSRVGRDGGPDNVAGSLFARRRARWANDRPKEAPSGVPTLIQRADAAAGFFAALAAFLRCSEV